MHLTEFLKLFTFLYSSFEGCDGVNTTHHVVDLKGGMHPVFCVFFTALVNAMRMAAKNTSGERTTAQSHSKWEKKKRKKKNEIE